MHITTQATSPVQKQTEEAEVAMLFGI